MIVEQVFGAALGQLRYSPERYWKELRIALPMAVTAPQLDRRADVAQVGMWAAERAMVFVTRSSDIVD